MQNPTLAQVYKAIPIRTAVELHQKLKGTEEVTPQTRLLVQQALRSAGKTINMS
jgi:hypothetical protein